MARLPVPAACRCRRGGHRRRVAREHGGRANQVSDYQPAVIHVRVLSDYLTSAAAGSGNYVPRTVELTERDAKRVVVPTRVFRDRLTAALRAAAFLALTVGRGTLQYPVPLTSKRW